MCQRLYSLMNQTHTVLPNSAIGCGKVSPHEKEFPSFRYMESSAFTVYFASSIYSSTCHVWNLTSGSLLRRYTNNAPIVLPCVTNVPLFSGCYVRILLLCTEGVRSWQVYCTLHFDDCWPVNPWMEDTSLCFGCVGTPLVPSLPVA